MVAGPGGKIGPVYELGQRFSVGEMCYVRQSFRDLIHETLMGNCSVSSARGSGCTRACPNRRSHSSDTSRSRDILECSQPNTKFPEIQNVSPNSRTSSHLKKRNTHND